MKAERLFCIAFITAVMMSNIASQAGELSGKRIRYTINDCWRFSEGDNESAMLKDFDDSRWDIVNLPHTFNAKDDFAELKEYRRPVTWYRKNLFLPKNLKGKKIYIYFEGVNQVADVFVNGKNLGRHIGGYTGFRLTELIRFRPLLK